MEESSSQAQEEAVLVRPKAGGELEDGTTQVLDFWRQDAALLPAL